MRARQLAALGAAGQLELARGTTDLRAAGCSAAVSFAGGDVMRLCLALFMTVSMFAASAEAGSVRNGLRKVGGAAVKVARRPFGGRRCD